MKLNEIYKCNICGNVVEVVYVGGGQLICCGQPMELLQERTKDEGYEKHVPVVEEVENGIKIKVGAISHPMEKEHHIEWIELIADGKIDKLLLKPGSKPEAEFEIKPKEFTARVYCNIHGLWKS